MHPKFAAIGEDTFVAYSCMTNSTWVLAWALQEVQSCATNPALCLSCIYPQTPSSTWLLSISRASWCISLGSKQWWQDHLHIGSPREHQPETQMTRPQAQWWRTRDWVWIPGWPWPSTQTLCGNPRQHKPGFGHLPAFPGLAANPFLHT